MNENALWRWLADRLPPGAYTRIESECSPGVPDVNYSLAPSCRPTYHKPCVHGWLELKIGGPGKYPFKGERRGLRPSQRLFLKEALANNVPCVIAAAIGSAFAIWRPADIHPLTWVDHFNELERDELLYRASLWVPRRGFKLVPAHLLF